MKSFQNILILISVLFLIAGCGEDPKPPSPPEEPKVEEPSAEKVPEPEPVEEKIPDEPEPIIVEKPKEEVKAEVIIESPKVAEVKKVEAPSEVPATVAEEPARTEVQEARVLVEEATALVEQAETAEEMTIAEEIKEMAEEAVIKAELGEPDAPVVIEQARVKINKETPPPIVVEEVKIQKKTKTVKVKPQEVKPQEVKHREVKPQEVKLQEVELLKKTPEAITLIAAPAEEVSEPIVDMGIVYFDYDKSSIKNEYETIIQSNFEWLVNNPDMRVQLEGHCDERGTNEYNLALGERRARAVLNYLLKQGADPEKFSIVSFGEERPVAMGSNESAWQKNRRVEFTRL